MYFRTDTQIIFLTQTLVMNISIVIAQEEHFKYAEIICDTIESSVLLRGTGIAKELLTIS
jgi:hypothetical protein